MNTVAQIHTAVNSPTLDDVYAWHTLKADRGEITHNAARQRNTALSQLTSILGPEEARDPASVLEHLPDTCARWTRLNSANSETARTYLSRARAALTDYIAFQADPVKFKFKVRESASERPKAAKEKGAKVHIIDAEIEETPKPPMQVVMTPPPVANPALPEMRGGEERRTFPLGKDRAPFVFVLPPDGLSVHEVKRVACHLLTLAHDFDPTMPAHAEVFAIVSRRSE